MLIPEHSTDTAVWVTVYVAALYQVCTVRVLVVSDEDDDEADDEELEDEETDEEDEVDEKVVKVVVEKVADMDAAVELEELEDDVVVVKPDGGELELVDVGAVVDEL